jgi:hypothetical protein
MTTTISAIDLLLKSIKDPKSDDYELANEISKTLLTSCPHHSSPSNVNPSTSYAYANNPGIHSCSVSSRKNNDDSRPVFCVYPMEQSNCPLYQPDFSVIRKVRNAVDIDTDYYLSRFRFYDGTYFYKIYDNNLNVYSELKYSKIQMENDNLNIEANALFNKFLIDLSLQFTEEDIAPDAVLTPVQKETNSYLKTLVSKESCRGLY